jgi:hypothetical protein
MWKVSKSLWIITTAPLVIVGIVLLYLGFTTAPGALTEDGLPLNLTYYLAGCAFIVFPCLTALGIYMYYKRINDREMFLIRKGIKGEATILHCEQTGTFINNLPEIRFKLKISVPYRPIYEVDHKDVVSLLNISSIADGKKLPVLIDPKNPNNILIVYDE